MRDYQEIFISYYLQSKTFIRSEISNACIEKPSLSKRKCNMIRSRCRFNVAQCINRWVPPTFFCFVSISQASWIASRMGIYVARYRIGLVSLLMRERDIGPVINQSRWKLPFYEKTMRSCILNPCCEQNARGCNDSARCPSTFKSLVVRHALCLRG